MYRSLSLALVVLTLGATAHAQDIGPIAPGPLVVVKVANARGMQLQQITGYAPFESTSCSDEGRYRVCRTTVRPTAIIEELCTAPCTATVGVHRSLGLDGPGVRSTPWFRLPSDRSTFELHVQPVKSGPFHRGLGFTIAGGAALPVGALLMLTALVVAVVPSDELPSARTFAVAGGAVLAAGATLLTLGIVPLARHHGRSTVTTDRGERLASGLSLTPRGLVF